MKKLFAILLLLIVLFGMASCGSQGGSSTGTQNGSESQNESSTGAQNSQTKGFVVTVLNSSGNFVSPVTLSISEDKNNNGIFENSETEILTSSDGTFSSLPKTSKYQRLVEVFSPGYVPIFRVIKANEPLPDLFTLQETKIANIDNSGGVKKIYTDNVTIEIPSTRSSSSVPDVAYATIGYYDPSKLPENMPGNFEADFEGPSILNSVGAFDVNLYDSSGKPVNLPIGNYRIRFKVNPNNYLAIEDYIDNTTDKIEVPLWSFDKKLGKWVYTSLGYLVDKDGNYISQDELRLIQSGQENKDIYVVGNVKHFSYVNADFNGKRGAVCGKIEGLPKGANAWVIARGKNGRWHSSGTVDSNGNFCVPVPVSEKSQPFNKDCNCSDLNISGKGYIKLLQDISDKLKNGNLPAECYYHYVQLNNAILESFTKDILPRLYYIADNLADKDTAENLRSYADFIEQDLLNKNYDAAFRHIRELNKIYGRARNSLTSEDYMKIYRNLKKQSINDTISQLIGVSFKIKGKEVSVSNLFAETTGVLYEAATKNIFPGSNCAKVSKGVIKKIGDSFIQNMGVDAFSSAVSGGKLSFKEVLSSGVHGTFNIWNAFNTAFNTLIDSNTMKFDTDVIGCLKDISKKLKNSEEYAQLGEQAAQLAEDMEEISAAASEATSKAALKNLAKAAIAAQIAATGIQVGFDEHFAWEKLKNLNLQDRVDDDVRLLMSSIANALRKYLPDECLTDDLKRDLAGSPDTIPECCHLLKMSTSYLYQYLYGSRNISRVSSKNANTRFYPLYATEQAVNALIHLSSQVSEVTGITSPYSKWINTKNYAFVKLPTSLKVQSKNSGGYVSRLILAIFFSRQMNVPLTGKTDMGIDLENLVSPGISEMNSYESNLGAWIGTVKPKINFKTVNLTLDFSKTGYSVKDIKSIILSKEYEYLPITGYCSVLNKSIKCSFPCTFQEFLNNVVRISLNTTLNKENKQFTLIGYFYAKLNTNSIINVPIAEVKRPVIESIEFPQVVSPNERYKVAYKITYQVTTQTVPSMKKGIDNNSQIIYQASLGNMVLGESADDNFYITIPEKKTLMDFIDANGNLYLGFKVCNGNRCNYKFKAVKVKINNNPPRISKITGPGTVEPGDQSVTFEIQTVDDDNDSLHFYWKYPKELVPRESSDNASLTFSVIHPTGKDVDSQVCAIVSDGIDSSKLCKNVYIKAVQKPPIVNNVYYHLDNNTAPTWAEFDLDVTSYDNISKVFVDLDGDGRADDNFTTLKNIHIRLEDNGIYSLGFWVKDSNGLTSNIYKVSFALLKGFNLVSMNPQAEVSSVSDGDIIIKINLNPIIQGNGSIINYRWDIDNDGNTDFTTSSPVLLANINRKIANNIGVVNVTITTTQGDFSYLINLSNIIKPYISLTCSPKSGNAPLNVGFYLKAYKPGCSIKTIDWDFDGDGSFDIETDNTTIQHSFSVAGNYIPDARITFSDGSSFEISGCNINVSAGNKLKIEVIKTEFLGNVDSVNTVFFHKHGSDDIISVFRIKDSNDNYYKQAIMLDLDKDFNIRSAKKMVPNNGYSFTLGSNGYSWFKIMPTDNSTYVYINLWDKARSITQHCIFNFNTDNITGTATCVKPLNFSWSGFSNIFQFNNHLVGYGQGLYFVFSMDNNIVVPSKVYKVIETKPDGSRNTLGINTRIVSDGNYLYVLDGYLSNGIFALFKVNKNFDVVWKKEYNMNSFNPNMLKLDDNFIYLIGRFGIVMIDKNNGDVVKAGELPYYSYYGHYQRITDLDYDSRYLYATVSCVYPGYTDYVGILSKYLDSAVSYFKGELCENSGQCATYLNKIFAIQGEAMALGTKRTWSDTEEHWIVGIPIKNNLQQQNCDYFAPILNPPNPSDLTNEIIENDSEMDLEFAQIDKSSIKTIKTYISITNINASSLKKEVLCGQ